MRRRLIYLSCLPLVLSFFIGGSSVAFEIFKVDLGCPGAAISVKEGWTPWEVPGGCDGDRHDGRGISDIDGTGINAYISIYQDGGHGNLRMGSGEPICNTAYQHWLDGEGPPEINLELSLSGLAAGEYALYTYHCWAAGGTIESITVSGDGITEIQRATNVPIQTVSTDDDLVPSEIRFLTDGSGTAKVVYAAGSGNPVVNAFSLHSAIAPDDATNPIPVDGADGVAPDVVLGWDAGAKATSHDVYLGTDLDAVQNATPASDEYKGNQLQNTFDPGVLQLGQTYYWRVDEINDADPGSPWTGKVWSFTVEEGKASGPSPEDGAKVVPQDATLSWISGTLATSHDVYLGTDRDAVENATPASSEYKGNQLENSFVPGVLDKATTYYWRIDGVHDDTTVIGDVWSFTTQGALLLQVDLGLPQWGTTEPWPETVKPGWWPYVASRWADMYSHDAVWERGENGEGPPPETDGIAGTGVHVALGTGNVGQGGLHVRDMCRGNLAGDEPPTGTPMGDPIANSWLYAVDWAGDPAGDILMRINGLPAGEYELIGYHNHWEPCTQSTRNCTRCVCDMPPMPRIYARSLPVQGLPEYGGKWNFTPGTGTGVTSIEEAFNVAPSNTFLDEEVSTSKIKFQTDGSDVLVIYEAGPNSYPDCARPGREGSRAILNAFELELVSSMEETQFQRGNTNDDDIVDISDAVTIFGYLFLGDPENLSCEKSADVNDSGVVDISDGIYLLESLFLGGDSPLAPYPECGTDLTEDNLTCESFPLCE